MDRYVIQAAHKTLQILLAFGEAPHRFTAAQIAEMLGLDRGQVFRSLRTLEKGGFVRAAADQTFELSPVVGTLALAVNPLNPSLADLARPYLAELVAATRETAALSALAGDQAVLLDLREPSRAVRWAALIGRSFPLHVGGGKAILAFLPQERREEILARLPELPAYTPRTLTDPQALRADLERARRQGYAVGDEDYDPETRSVSAPVFDQQGRVVAALSLAGPSFRFPPESIPARAEEVMDYAQQISRQLGYAGLYPKPYAGPGLEPEGGEVLA